MEKEHYKPVLKAKKAFIKEVHRRRLEDQCSTYCVVNNRGQHAIPGFLGCFAKLDQYFPGAMAVIVWINKESMVRETKVKEGDGTLYLDWLLNRSPWKTAFVTRNVGKAWRDCIVVLNTDAPANMMVGGAVGVRRLWETKRIITTWIDLVKAGVHEDLAYYLACVSQHSGGIGSGTVAWGAWEGAHENLGIGAWGTKELLNFLNHKPNGNWLRKSYKEQPHSRHFSHLWCAQVGDGSINRYIEQEFGKNAAKVEEKPSVNPFAKAVAAKVALGNGHKPYKEAIQLWSEFQHVLFKHIGFDPKALPKPVAIEPPVVKVFKRDNRGRFCA